MVRKGPAACVDIEEHEDRWHTDPEEEDLGCRPASASTEQWAQEEEEPNRQT
jgi:hypothetical protein